MDRKGRESGRLQSDLTRRLDDFQKRGLLSAKMTEHYKMNIVKVRQNPLKFKPFVEQVQKDLDRIESENEETKAPPVTTASPTSSTFSSGTSASVSAFTEIASAVNSNASSVLLNKHPSSILSRSDLRKHTDSSENQRGADKHIKWGDNASKTSGISELAQAFERRNSLRPIDTKKVGKSSGAFENRNNASENGTTTSAFQRLERKHGGSSAPRSSPMIVELQDAATQMGDEQMQELFVEMCFFARLGYVQPPCCLRCTYREALKDGNAQSHCPRWVIWRKDTTQLLHPHKLEGNLLMVQCRAAGRLLAGKKIEGYEWSIERQGVYSDGS